jgi:hypothetical protein
MTEIRRWLETGEARPEVLDLLGRARLPLPLDARTRARSRRRIAALGALPAAAGTFLWIKSVALGAVLGGAATAAVLVPKWRSDSEQEVPATRVVAPVSHRRPSQMQVAPPAESAPVSAVSSREPVRLIPQANASIAAGAAPPLGSSVPNDLAREIQLLERARQLLNVNPGLALETLNEHRREFGTATLVLEREFLMVETLWRLGRPTEARARAAELRRRAPGSLYERRLAQLLGGSAEPPPSDNAELAP